MTLEQTINTAWDGRDSINASTKGEARDAVEQALSMLDSGEARVAEKTASGWAVHQWLKKAVLLSFRLNPMSVISGGPGDSGWYDKGDSKFKNWGEGEFAAAGFRAVP
ncbi:MAG TPA: 2,3,4,5-tetrahydropyridine-2,6-dicarboxylate N-succinyltransferase, partial [Alphaproteobacteria bacterium]|nr:2,3,4,5-tetrahydropyridine-2,6-dicarboxylate N-succinyltransferase [Alphaproteobacteria bacterium]